MFRILIKSFFILISLGLIILFWKTPNKGSEIVVCPKETKTCSDGTIVMRISPKCDFSKCSDGETNSSFGNNHIEESIANYLLTEKYFSWKTKDESFNFCSIENLDKERQIFPLYIWAYCAEYIMENNELKSLSGSSGPVKINYPNELSYYNLNKFSYEAPGDGSHYTEDIKNIFPESIQQEIFNFDRKNIITKNEEKALSNILSWVLIKESINNCEVKEVFQAHSKKVSVTLKNGNKLEAVESKIDEIIKIATGASQKCGEILMGTE